MGKGKWDWINEAIRETGNEAMKRSQLIFEWYHQRRYNGVYSLY